MKKKIFILLGLAVIIFLIIAIIINNTYDDKDNKIEVKQNIEKTSNKDFDFYYFARYNKDGKLIFIDDLKNVNKIEKEPEITSYIFYFDKYSKYNKKIKINVE